MELACYCSPGGIGGEVEGDPTRWRDEVKQSDQYGKMKTTIRQHAALSNVSMSISKGQGPYRDDAGREGSPETSQRRRTEAAR